MLYKNQELVHLIEPENECEGAHVWEDPKHEKLIILKVSGKTYEVSFILFQLL